MNNGSLGRMKEQTDEWIYRSINPLTDQCPNNKSTTKPKFKHSINQPINQLLKEMMNECMIEWMDERMKK